MTRLPVVSGAQLIQVLQYCGWTVKRQKGSHVVLTKRGCRLTLSVPFHPELATGTLKGILKDAGLTVDDLLRLMES